MDPIISIKRIVKVYPNGVVANKGVSVDIEPTTIHAIVGENGAGKTTLMKILFGIEEAQEGEIFIRGKKVHFKSPIDAIKMGIGMVHQQLMLAEDLTVCENLTLGIEPRMFGVFLNKNKAFEIADAYSKKFGIDVPLNKKVKDLPIGVKQRVEILKALLRNVDVLILDEPTSVLTPQETEVFFKTLFSLRDNGKTIIFISHKLKEVKAIADKITIMRDGKVVITEDAKDVSEHEIARLMVGREITFEHLPKNENVGTVIFEVQNLSYKNDGNVEVLKNISFAIRSGEILAIAGVDGNGQTELVEILTGLKKATSGNVLLDGKSILGLSPREIREKNVSHIPEDRMKNGVADKAKIKENLISDRYYKEGFSKGERLDWNYIDKISSGLIKKFNILALSGDTTVNALSGGNIQKVVVARELSLSPRVIIADQPIRGIDVGSEELVHSLLKDARDNGSAVLLVSADLDEILKLATHIIVIYDGEIVVRFDSIDNITGQDLGPYMLGIKREA